MATNPGPQAFFSVEAIPEPATLGLISRFGTGVVGARRLQMR